MNPCSLEYYSEMEFKVFIVQSIIKESAVPEQNYLLIISGKISVFTPNRPRIIRPQMRSCIPNLYTQRRILSKYS